jgi:hypothetical protein
MQYSAAVALPQTVFELLSIMKCISQCYNCVVLLLLAQLVISALLVLCTAQCSIVLLLYGCYYSDYNVAHAVYLQLISERETLTIASRIPLYRHCSLYRDSVLEAYSTNMAALRQYQTALSKALSGYKSPFTVSG